MLGWIFKKNDSPTPDVPAPPAAQPAGIDWEASLRAAAGDDAALLALARAAAPVDTKLAAIGALAGEDALKQAEREFRSHDRRVHRLAKQRHQAMVTQRESRVQADRLIGEARALLALPLIPANRLVALDQSWQALDGALLDAMQRDDFAAALAQLAALSRERGDQALTIERWLAEARRAVAQLQASAAQALAGGLDRAPFAEAVGAARKVVDAAPQDAAAGTLREALQAALARHAQLEERLAVLDELLQTASDGNGENTDAVTLRWQLLPALDDRDVAAVLDARFEQWRQSRDQARQARRQQQREEKGDRRRAAREAMAGSLGSVLEQAEAALAAGHLGETNQHLVEIDGLLHGGAPAQTLRGRIDALQAEYARLRGWQHWGGGVARDELVLEAEALAAASRGEGDAPAAKLPVKQQSERINDLRARWKALDRLGGATSRALWQRFDAALAAAYQQVAAHLEVQRGARQQNLLARRQLIEQLEGLPSPGAGDDGAPPDWRPLAAALDRFHTEWRKLGPLEHTVAHAERAALVERLGLAVQRLEVPLNEARRAAQGAREQLVEAARSVAAQASEGGQGRDLVNRLRDLQAEWQRQAKALPLSRGVESALWGEFRAAIDAAFGAREAAFSAREETFKAHGAERTKLIERIEALPADAPPAELKRTLAEVDAQWQRGGPAPRHEAAALDARWRQAREAVQQRLAGAAQRGWHTTCDALLARLALCEALESREDGDAARAELALGWPAQPALPPAWERALAQRAGLGLVTTAPPANGPSAALSVDELLLRLEAALTLASPPAFEAARRTLKLQALKSALEGGPSSAAAPPGPGVLLAELLGRCGLDDGQRERQGAILAALRQRGPGDVA
jgi:hypothetical protein